MHLPGLTKNCQHFHSGANHLYMPTTSSETKNETTPISQTVSSGFFFLLPLPVPLLHFCSLLAPPTSQENIDPTQQVALMAPQFDCQLWSQERVPRFLHSQHSTYRLHIAVEESRKLPIFK